MILIGYGKQRVEDFVVLKFHQWSGLDVAEVL